MADEVLTDQWRFRTELPEPEVRVVPGTPVPVRVRVVNVSSVIETLQLQLIGIVPDAMTPPPREHKLFPGESVELSLELTLPPSLPAGLHECTIVASGVSGHIAPGEAVLQLLVPPVRAAELRAEPPVRTGGRRTQFLVDVVNTGNSSLTAQVLAADVDQHLTVDVDRPVREVHQGTTEQFELHAKGRRPWLGGIVERRIAIELEYPGGTATTDVVFRQKPRLTAGLITLLTLAFIGLLWAAAMFFGVTSALGAGDPVKVLPASFTADTDAPGGGGVSLADLDPSVVGGSIEGVITAESTGLPVARATVEAFDQDGESVGATATGDDGAFSLDALLPTRYQIRVRAPGFSPVWWPSATDAAGAGEVSVSPDTAEPGVDVALPGLPGSLGGTAIVGDDAAQQVTVTVTSLDLVGDAASATTTADADGLWRIDDLPAPATYEIRYAAPGYSTVQLTQPLEAGQQTNVNTVRLPAAIGTISGIVLDQDGNPLGGIEIEAQRGQDTFSATTPTAGEIGTFQLVDLQTPGTYLLTFSGENRASETRAVRLGPGESLESLEVVLAASTGIIRGTVEDSSGVPLGGVTVTVAGGDTVLTTETFTSGQVGSFVLGNVPAPGTYAVTFEHPSHERETLQAVLTLEEPSDVLDVQLVAATGSVTGTVVDALTGDPLGAVTVEVSDGEGTRTTITVSDPQSQRGQFVVSDLEPGSYTITATNPNGDTVTVLRSVAAGAPTNVRLTLGGAP